MQADNPIKLSICIPTFNRVDLLKETMESVLLQAEKERLNILEVVISDNDSADGTCELAGKLQGESKVKINYFKNEKNAGFDINCLLAVERARGQYVWLLGDDDPIVEGALAAIINELYRRPPADIVMGDKEDIYLTADHPMRHRPVMNAACKKIFDFSNSEVIDKYFHDNNKLIAYGNFLSNVIFSREKWLRTNGKNNYVGTGYIHLYVFQSILWGSQPGVLKYLPLKLIKRRWGNDSAPALAGDDELPIPEARLKQDVLNYRQIANAVFADKKCVRRIDELVLINDGYSWAVRAKINNRWRFYFAVFPFLFGNYWSQPLFWFKIVPLLFIPNIILSFMRGLYRLMVKGESLSAGELFAG